MSSIFQIKTNEQEELEHIYSCAIEKLNEFFEIKWEVNKPKVYVVKDRKTAEALRDKQTPEWVVGWNGNGIAFVLDKDEFLTSNTSTRNDDDYKMLIMHELAHLYFKVLTGGKSQPNWLWEGVAILAAGQAEKWDKPQEFKSFLSNEHVYSEAGYALLLLVNKYGKEKLIQLLKTYRSYSGDFSNLFKEIYHLDLTYDSLNNLIQK